MALILTYLLLLGIPAAVLTFFGISLIRFCTLRRREKRAPGAVEPALLRRWQICMIASAVIVGVFAAVVLTFAALFMMAIAYM